MVCDGHKSGMLFSICGISPKGTKFFFPVGVKPFGSNKRADDIFEMVKSVIIFIVEIQEKHRNYLRVLMQTAI